MHGFQHIGLRRLNESGRLPRPSPVDRVPDVVIRAPQPVAARMPVYCRREDGRSTQGQPPSACDGIFTDVSKGLRGCPKCGLTHAFAVIDGELRYGTVL